MRRGLVVAVVTVAVGAGALVTGAPAAAGDDTLRRSREAARRLSFTGTVVVEWEEAGSTRRQVLDVSGVRGLLLVDGPQPLLARHGERYAYRRGSGWDLLLPGGDLPPLPDPTGKYDITGGAGPTVAGRPTRLIEVRLRGRLLERLYADADNGLILRRVQLDRGRTHRTVSFQRISEGPITAGDPAPVATPATTGSARPRFPPRLAGSYRRVAVTAHDGVQHALYSDGLYGLSVFRQTGRLRSRDVPDRAARVAIAGRRGWHVAWPGGEVLMWQAGEAVYTAVGDGPLVDVIDVAASLPDAGRASIASRLRRVCRGLLRAFA